MLIRELQKFITAFILVTFYVVYYNSDYFRNSIIDSIKTTFDIWELDIFLFAIFFFIIAYLTFNLVYLIISQFLKLFSKDYSPFWTTTLIFIGFITLYILNDQILISIITPREMTDYFVPQNKQISGIDSTNFNEFIWERNSIEYYNDSENWEKENLAFYPNSSFKLSHSSIKFDRLYLIRELFDLTKNYEIEGNYIYANSLHKRDSLNSSYSVILVNNKLFFDKWLSSTYLKNLKRSN